MKTRLLPVLLLMIISLTGSFADEVPAPTGSDIAYGSDEQQMFDIWISEEGTSTTGKRPLFIYFHGGGFIGGDKSVITTTYADLLEQLLSRGISVISANYRLVNGETHYPAPMVDGVMLIQKIRKRASEWIDNPLYNEIDPDNIFLGGSSAGADIALWIAMCPDFKDFLPDAEGTWNEYSSRVKCVISFSGQTTIDPWFIREHLWEGIFHHPTFKPLYGVESNGDFDTMEMRNKCRLASAISHVTADDPPALLHYSSDVEYEPLPFPSFFNDINGEIGYKTKLRDNGIDVFNEYTRFDPDLPLDNELTYRSMVIHNKCFGEIMYDNMTEKGISGSVLSYPGHNVMSYNGIINWALLWLDYNITFE